MRFPAHHTFTMEIPSDSGRIKIEVEGCYEDEYQFCVESVTSDETGEDITDTLNAYQIELIDEKGCEEYPEYMVCRAEEMYDRLRDR